MRVFILAGEPSGDRLGGALMAGLQALQPDVRFDGIGGPEMQARGLQSRFPMDELSVMGVAEVLPKYFHLKRRIAETAQAVIDTRPDVLITIDSPDFSLRVARKVKEHSSIRTVHYVAPSVWAWRPKRAAKMARVIDHVLALLPFEPPYMEAEGMMCDFVGHPVVADPVATPDDIARFRAEHGLGDQKLMLVLPGSRKGEVTRLSADFGAALRLFLSRHPDLRPVIPAAGPVADLVRAAIADWPGHPLILDPRGQDAQTAAAHKRAAFAAGDLALAASGTVALELAAARTPMVIGYKVQWLTWQIVKNMFFVDTANLVNLVSDTRVVPECIADGCTPQALAQALDAVHADPTAQTDAMDLTMDRLGRGGDAPGLRAARAVLRGLG
ncbi:MAG: lipid-A-disaccharide synthase [Marinibacterium sp.]|nr:lipid-A-disaccharide synthase [Marinibacterium sp.]